ncbi:hypothetical protein [Micrococcus sp. IITD107]|uniref:hypothetical protein n=1 Tax=Micrococcus sp. IITD107 TaxID=3342790 RepID=UPI0035BA6736
MSEAPRRSHRRSPLPLVLGGLGAVLVGAAGAAGISWANHEVRSPTAPVEQYLEALQDGDGAAALGLSGAALPEGTEAGTQLLDGEPLAAAVADLQDLEVQDAGHATGAVTGSTAPAPDTERRQIEVTGTAGGTPFRTVFTVSHQGRDWLFFDRWAMDPLRLPTVTVEPRGLTTDVGAAGSTQDTDDDPLSATLNGAHLPLTGADGSLVAPRLAVFPPAHLQTRFQSSHLASEPAQLTVARAGQDEVLPLTVTATELAVERVQEQVEQYLDQCTEQQVLHPTGCPLDYQSAQRVEPSSIRWEMVQMPQFAQAQLISAGPLTEATLEGTARITVTERDLMTGAQQRVQEDLPVTFTGTVLVTPESVRFTPEVR